jgi:hypothetical protein
MDNSLQLLILAAGIIIVCVVVAIGIFITKSGKNQINSVQSQISQAISEFDNPNLQVYEGNTVTGLDVKQADTKYGSGAPADSQYKITVKDTAGNTVYSYTPATGGGASAGGTDAATTGSLDKIKTNGMYVGSLHRDDNTVIDELIFTQQELLLFVLL